MNRFAGSLRAWLWTAFGCALVWILLIGGIGLASQSTTAREFSQLDARTLPLLNANTDMLQALTDAQTAQRGFLLTGSEKFVGDYARARTEFFAAAAQARTLADGGLDAVIREEETAASRWIEEFADPVMALRPQGEEGALEFVASGAGPTLFQSYRAANERTSRALEARASDELVAAGHLNGNIEAVFVALLIAGLGMGTVVAARTTRAVTAALEGLTTTVHRLRAGELGARGAVGGPSEIAAVAAAINELAVENERLTAFREEQLRTAQIIRRVAGRLKQCEDVQGIAAAVATELGHTFAAEQVIVNLADEEGRQLARGGWTAAPNGSAPIEDRLTCGLESLVGSAEVQPRAHVIPDISGSTLLDDPTRALLLQGGAGALLHLRLQDGTGSSNTLTVLAATPRQWPDEAAAVLEGIGRESYSALMTAEAFARQQRVVTKLQQLDSDKSDFISTASHELRTPLTSIMGYIELLQDGCAGKLLPEQERALETVARNSTRLLELIEDLWTLSRIEAGSLPLKRELVDISALTARIGNELISRFAARRLDFTVDAQASGGVVRGDSSQLERVLYNLLSNAAKFTSGGGEVRVTTRRCETTVEIVVSDTGMGIPVEEQDRVFERFFRSSSAQDLAVAGTGLGLSITRGIVEQHGGTVSLQSTPDQGTSFRVALPLAEGIAA